MKSKDIRVHRVDVIGEDFSVDRFNVIGTMDKKVEQIKAEILESVTQDLMESNLTYDEYEEIKNKIIDIFLEY